MSMSDSSENALEIELESLEAIYINELTYSRNSDGTVNQIELLLHPATGHDLSKQYVCMTLVFTLNTMYPNEPPGIEIHNPRGLGEEEISSLVEDMVLKAEDMKGDAMLYTLIEMAKDSLTEGNMPHCPCVVCLEHFDQPDSFHRTACYHYYHTHCLYKYLIHTRIQMEEEDRDTSERRHLDINNKPKKVVCPVCRSPLDEESLAITCSQEVLENNEKTEVFVIPPALKEQQMKMAQLYEKQKAKGGIIDLELERNKYLVNPEDRVAIRSVVVAPHVISQDAASKLPRKHDSGGGRKENSSKYGGSSQQYRNRGKNWGQGNFYHGKSNTGRPGSKSQSENWDSHPSRGSNRKVKVEQNLKKDEGISEGRKVSNEGQDSEKSRKDYDGSENIKIDRENKGFSERYRGGMNSERNQQQEDRFDKDISGVNLEYCSNEFHKGSDMSGRTVDEYERGHPTRLPGRGRGRGRFTGNQSREKYEVQPHHRFYEQSESMHHDGVNQGRRNEKVNVKDDDVKETQSSRVGPHDITDEKRLDGFGGEFLENVERNEKYRNMDHDDRCVKTSAEVEVLRGASGFDQSFERGVDSQHSGYDDDVDYRREVRDRRRVERFLGDESRGYHRGSGGQRSRGSESRQKGSKFNERRDTDQSRQSHGRPHQQRSHQYHHHQHQYHHNRHGEERERTIQSKKCDTNIRVKEEIISKDSRTSISDVLGDGASSETVAEDEGEEEEEEADIWRDNADSSPWQSLTFEGSQLIGTDINMTTNVKSVSLKRLDFHGTNDMSKTRNIIREPHNSYDARNISRAEYSLLRKVNNKYDLEHKDISNFSNNRVSKQNYNCNVNSHRENKNIISKRQMQRSFNNKSKEECNKEKSSRSEYNLDRNADLNIEAKDISSFPTYRTNKWNLNYFITDDNNNKEQCQLERSNDFKANIEFKGKSSAITYNANIVLNCDDGDEENWDDEVNIYAFERYKVRPEHLEDYDKQVAPRNKYFENKLKARCEEGNVVKEEFKRIMNEKLRRCDKQEFEFKADSPLRREEKVDPLKEKSVLEMFKESQTRHFKDSNNEVMLNTPDILSDYSSKLVAKTEGGLRKLELNTLTQDVSTNYHYTHSLQHQDVDRINVIGRTTKKITGPDMSNDKLMASVSETNSELPATEDDHRQFSHTMTHKSGKLYQSYSTIDSYHSDAAEITGHGQPAQVFYQGQSTKDPGQCQSTKVSGQGKKTKVYSQGQSTKFLAKSQSTVVSGQPNKFFDEGQSTIISGQPNKFFDEGQSTIISGQPNKFFDEGQSTIISGQPNKFFDEGQSTIISGLDQPTKGSSNVIKDVPPDSFHHSTSSNILTTKDGYISSKSRNSSFLNSDGLSFPSQVNSHGTLLTKHLVSSKMTANIGTLHKDENIVHKNEVSSIPQSFNSHFKKVPPLEFPKKTQNNTSKNSSLYPVAKTTVVKDKSPTEEIFLCNKSPQGLEHIDEVKWSSTTNDFSNSNNVPMLPMLNTQVGARFTDLSAALLNSYKTTCLVSASLLSIYKNSLGLNPTLASLYHGCADNLCLHNLYALDSDSITVSNSSSSQTFADTTPHH